jgi:hypothetical protein
VLIAPECEPHRTRTDLAVSERYLIVAKCGIQASDKHDFFAYHIFHIAAGLAALVEASEATSALSRFVDYLLRYFARHRFFNSAGFAQALASPETHYPYYTGAMQSSCRFPELESARTYFLFGPAKPSV